MNYIPTTATAVEKLNREAKSRRKYTGTTLAAALDEVAVEAGYGNWKHVTECAAYTQAGNRAYVHQAHAVAPLDGANDRKYLLPASHRHLLYIVRRRGIERYERVKSIGEICEAFGGVEPLLIRHPCGEAMSSGVMCLCQLDPFATARRAGVALDIGDKHDSWNYLLDANSPSREHPGWLIRAKFGLATQDDYPNEHVTHRANDDRTNSLNPNNPSHAASADNRSMQLNPDNLMHRR